MYEFVDKKLFNFLDKFSVSQVGDISVKIPWAGFYFYQYTCYDW